MHTNIHFARFAAGFLAILPLALTIALVVWLAGFVAAFLGPGSWAGGLFTRIGLAFVTHPAAAYSLGILILLAAIYVLGVIVRSRLKGTLGAIGDALVRPIPLVGQLYGMTSKFVSLLDRREDADLRAMTPVWCFFGGAGGTAVLGLMPSPEPLVLHGKPYRAVLIPTAPVPFGGGLIYVPEDWVEPAGIGVEGLTSTYVSMGISAPVETGTRAARP